MKPILLAIVLAAGSVAAALGQTPSHRPSIYPYHLEQQAFADAGLRFWVWAGDEPPQIWVNHILGTTQNGLMRSFVCVGKLGSNVPIYCVDGPTERDDTLILEAFLQGYKSAQVQ